MPQFKSQPAEPQAKPRIWCLMAEKRGDNGQVERVADALESQMGWSCERRQLVVPPAYQRRKPPVAPSLEAIDRAQSDPLEPPWPDLIITSGRRPANAALWIKQQSGGRCRLVLLGKPSGAMDAFDLIIASAETLLAPLPQVLPIQMPLMGVDPKRLAAARERWQGRLEQAPRPRVVFLLGGPTLPFVFDRSLLNRLQAEVDRCLASNASVYLVASRRTPAQFMARLRAQLPPQVTLYDWAQAQEENPYLGLLALADRFVVTGDSISMMVEVAKQGKPLEILPLATGWLGRLDLWRRGLAAWFFRPARHVSLWADLRLSLGRGLFRLGLLQQTRHFPRFHQSLVDAGIARWAGTPKLDDKASDTEVPAALRQSQRDIMHIVTRIAALLGSEFKPGERGANPTEEA